MTVNPFKDAPEELCRRILHIWDDLYDEEITQMAAGPLSRRTVTMLEIRVHMASTAKSLNVPPQVAQYGFFPGSVVSFPGPNGNISVSMGQDGTSQWAVPQADGSITYTVTSPGRPRSARKSWPKPRRSAR